jgi:hypothetical protein
MGAAEGGDGSAEGAPGERAAMPVVAGVPIVASVLYT